MPDNETVQTPAPAEPTAKDFLKNKKPAGVSVGWFNINSSEQVYTDQPAQIKGFIESSDLGVNRHSDKGWRLDPEWIGKIRKARKDRALLAELRKLSGGDVTDTQLLVAIFERESLAAEQIEADAEDAPFEQEYLDKIRPKSNK